MKSSLHILIPFSSLFSVTSDCRLKRLNYSQLALDPRYIASGRPQQKTPFPNNSSVFIEVCLLRRCIETAVLLLFECFRNRATVPYFFTTHSILASDLCRGVRNGLFLSGFVTKILLYIRHSLLACYMFSSSSCSS
jgi:hypothetical protein